MGARLFSGGERREADPGRGGDTVIDSFTPKSQLEGEPGLDSTLVDMSANTS